jgi:serine/threonine protein kinase
MSDLLEGVMLSDYFLLQCVSKGGIADVYRARQTEGGNYEVAIKVFRTSYAQRESFREYFMSEAEKIGQFEHPNILPFLEFGEGEGLLYSVTPYVPSGTLEELLRRVGGKLNAMQTLQIMQQLCSAVQYAHERNVIHGNIKPTNIFIAADSRMLLSDFGIVRGYDDSQQSLTRIGWGSAEYAAPEQSLGVLKRASDTYSLGVLLFRILTGEPPFTGQTPVEVLLKHVRQQAPSARSFDPNISDAVDDVLHGALQKRSDDRFASVEEFGNALTEAISIAPVASPVARTVTLKTHRLAPDQITIDPQTPVPAYIGQASSVSPITPAFSIGQSHALSNSVESSKNKTPSVGNFPVDEEDSDQTLAFKTNSLKDDEMIGTNKYWSTEPVEWSPIAKETGDAEPTTATDFLKDQPTSKEHTTNETRLKPELDEAFKNEAKVANTRPKKFLPILVVILLLIGLIAALLSSFILSNPQSSGDAGKVQHVVEVQTVLASVSIRTSSMSIFR